jgi:hypothetical protein
VCENEPGKALNEAEGMGILTGGFSTSGGLWSSARNIESLGTSFVGGACSWEGFSGNKE